MDRRQYDIVQKIIDSYCDDFTDLEKAKIELHRQFPLNMHPGVMSLMLAELLGNRYHYGEKEKNNREDLVGLCGRNEQPRSDESHPGPEHGYRRHFINERMEKYIPSGCNLLDFGCGGGIYKNYYEKCNKVTAVDVNPNALLDVRSRFMDKEKVRLILAPMMYTELEEESFDCILVSAVLGYVPHSLGSLILDECRRLLKPEGSLILALVPARGVCDFVARNDMVELPDFPGSFHKKYSKREISRLLINKGFKIITSDRYILKLPRSLRPLTSAIYRFDFVRFWDELINKLPGLSTWHITVGKK